MVCVPASRLFRGRLLVQYASQQGCCDIHWHFVVVWTIDQHQTRQMQPAHWGSHWKCPCHLVLECITVEYQLLKSCMHYMEVQWSSVLWAVWLATSMLIMQAVKLELWPWYYLQSIEYIMEYAVTNYRAGLKLYPLSVRLGLLEGSLCWARK